MSATVKLDPRTHIYTVDGRRAVSVTQALQSAGIIDTQYYNDEAALRGIYVHKAIQIYHEQGLNYKTLDNVLKPYVGAYIDWINKSGFRPVVIERSLYDHVYDYAGTPDLIGYLVDKNRLSVIDIKTGSMPQWTGLQLAAYQRLASKLIDNRPVVARYGLQLKANGKWSLKPFNNNRDLDVFLGALTVHHYKEGRI